MRMWRPTIRNPFRRKPEIDSDGLQVLTVHGDRDLWWVRIILNVGRPVVAVIVLVMCAPGEHYLARQAGFPRVDFLGMFKMDLAWGMPATLTAYAGIAAVVATKRPKGAPGKSTAVWGAIVSVVLAMAAQPIAHLYGRTGLGIQQIVLIIIVSCIPALVFGHLLHMAAVPNEVRPKITPGARHVPGGVVTFDDRDIPFTVEDQDDEDSEPGEDAFAYRAEDESADDQTTVGMDAGLDYLRGTEAGDNWSSERIRRYAREQINRPVPTYPNDDLHDVLRQVDVSPEGTTWPGHRADLVLVDDVPPADIRADNREDIDQGQTAVSGRVPVSRDTDTGDRGTGRDRPRSVPSRGRPGTGVTSRVRDILRDNPGTPEDKIRDTFAGEDIPRNTINKSIKRVKTEMGIN